MRLEERDPKGALCRFLKTEWPVLILLALVLLERLLFAWQNGTDHVLIINDSLHYYEAGLEFARSGRLTYKGFPSALIMPGPTVLIGLLARLFQPGEALLRAIQLVWICLGSLTALFLYKALRLFTPRWAALLGAAAWLLPNQAAIDTYLLTEGPYYLFFMAALYNLLALGQDGQNKHALGLGFSALLALLFRANILSFLLFAALYLLLLRKFSLGQLLRWAGMVLCILALFILPWTVRNYLRFGDFIPVTYGMGNPILDGTFFADMCPVDDQLDYAEPEAEIREKYASYYDEDGQLKDPQQQQYLEYMGVGIVGRYRLKEWFKRAPANFLKTYLWTKPRIILNWSWYWTEFLGLSEGAMHCLTQLNFLFCGWTVLLSLLLKKYREQILFLTVCYFINLYMIAFALPIDRYAQQLMLLRYVIAGLGLYLSAELVKRLRARRKDTPQQENGT